MEEEIILMEENDVEEINIEEENYSGKPYVLPIASEDVLGGIKVGENLTIDEDGTLNAQAGGSGGTGEENEMINVNLLADYSHTLSSAWTRQVIPFNNVMSSIGSNLSLTSEGRIKIGAGISKISINAAALVYRTDSVGTSDIGIRIIRNGAYTDFMSFAYHYLSKIKDYQTINNLVPLVDVQENDEIEMSYTSGTADTFKYSKAGTFLSVKKVNETNVISGNGSSKVGAYIQIYNGETIYLEPKTVTKLNFDNVLKNTTDDGLIYENGGVRIGKGVSQVLIISKWNNWTYNFMKNIYVYKNGKSYEMQSYPINVNSANITSYLDVEEGDFIEIYGYHESTSRLNINSNSEQSGAKIIIMR